MRRALAAAVVQAALAGCTSKADDAEAQYRIVSRSGTLGERCAKARDVRDAYLAAHDGDKYQRWQVTAGSDCLDAEMHSEASPADDKLRAQVESTVANVTAAADNSAAEVMARQPR